MHSRSRFTITLAIVCLSGCGGSPREPITTTAAVAHAPEIDAARALDLDHVPDLERVPAPKLIAIDWSSLAVGTDADALDVWKQIAPTGLDWEPKLEEIPGNLPVARQLALALLHEGNFTCMPATPAKDCAKPAFDVDAPTGGATLADPCLRRMLALWAIEELEDQDLPHARDALRAIAAIPPPESQLVAAALRALPESDIDGRYELLAIAWKAGQTALVNGSLGALDVPHLIDATTKLHIDGALEILSAEANRPTYLAAVTDEKLASAARTQAIIDLVATSDKLAPDVRVALTTAARSTDCTVAAAAARALEQFGLKQFRPKRSVAKPMRALCVLASFEQLQRNDEPSLLADFVPARGLELVKVAYDPYNEVDTDGDGDPHTEATISLVPKGEVVLPEIDDLVRAMRHCTGMVCKTDDHEFRFTFKGGYLRKLEVVERPPCSHN